MFVLIYSFIHSFQLLEVLRSTDFGIWERTRVSQWACISIHPLKHVLRYTCLPDTMLMQEARQRYTDYDPSLQGTLSTLHVT